MNSVLSGLSFNLFANLFWSSAGWESVLPTLTECVLPDRYDLNQPSASSLIQYIMKNM